MDKPLDTLTLTITFGNDAMLTLEDAADAIERALPRLRHGVERNGLYDLNGNRIGEYEVSR